MTKYKVIVMAISGVSVATITLINMALKFSMRALSRWELHETQTKTNVSVALKLTIARFINSSFVLLFANTRYDRWYRNGNLVWDATLLIVILVFQHPFMEIFYLPGILKWWKKRKAMA